MSDGTVPDPQDVDILMTYVTETVGTNPQGWPGGWPDEIEAAVIDTVFSIRARYGDRGRGTGVIGVVDRWRSHRGGTADDLDVLARDDPQSVRSVLRNDAKVAGRPKADVVQDVARSFTAMGIRHAEDLRRDPVAAKQAYLSVHGCGPVTWAYLRMLCDLDDVKADTWVVRFVRDKVPGAPPSEASRLVKAVASTLGVDAYRLDHAIWAYRRGV
ncbi:hypothetical protein [Lapillicoccus jejuensis]|uniref:Heme peroxidase n=1 Tax=Lapillicoccus jejuensis TaxID=402171 RepID=A0A542DYM0_9MICO|nr:hypothetical protein [Lapillicoccus jejuensis]TQJ08024.1 hypothetical protein FB458_1102 [Lapillicoccus jejuensis]